MKKTFIIICSLILACVLAAATFFTLATPTENDTIGSQKALELALQDAGIKSADVRDSKSVLTKKNQTQVFDVEFEFGKNNYDYIIDAKSGDIISRSVEVDDEKDGPLTTAAFSTEASTVKATDPATTVFEPQTSSEPQTISEPQTPSEPQTVSEPQTPSESKTPTTATEPASKVTDPAPTTEKRTAAFISINKAKKIALSHAGLSENEVRFEKVKLDKDDGIYEYEVEFYAKGLEYDYSVNAKTGKIIDFEIEKDD